MSKLVEQVAKEILEKYNQTTFLAGDINIIHDIYDECIKRGMKPVPNFKNGPHPTMIRKRIVNAMKTGYLFEHGWFPESILRKCTWFKLKE